MAAGRVPTSKVAATAAAPPFPKTLRKAPPPPPGKAGTCAKAGTFKSLLDGFYICACYDVWKTFGRPLNHFWTTFKSLFDDF